MNEAVLDTSARVQRIPAPIASPGSCGLCGKTDHVNGFASAGLDFEFYGTFILCYDCVGDYARTFGFMSREEITNLLDELNKQREELNVLRESVVNLENILDAYAKLRPNSGITDHRSIGAIVAASDGSEGAQDVSGLTEVLTDGGTSEDEGTTESVSKQGPDDVRDATSEFGSFLADLDV